MLTPLTIFYEGMDTWMFVLAIADRVLFVLFFISVAYLAFFSFLAMLSGHRGYKTARRKHRFVIIFPVHGELSGLCDSIAALERQDYPHELFDLVVTGPGAASAQIDSSLRVAVSDMGEERFSKRAAVLAAMDGLGAKAYDVAVIMDSGNVVDADFITSLNNAYSAGCKAIQTHRKAKSTPTDIALLGAASQEINNGIFRRGHVRIGLSSALAGSGMAFDYGWLKEHIGKARGDNLEKQLEVMMLEENIFIEYLNEVFTYEDQNERPAEFYRERRRWMATRFDNIWFAFSRLPGALLARNIDYCDKLFQWIIPSRTILLGTMVIISVGLLFVSWPMSLKWWGLLFLLILSFSMGLPDYMIDARFARAVKTMPLLFLLTVFNIFRRRVLPSGKAQPKTS